MREVRYTITDPNGIHARPAGTLVKMLKGFDSKVTVFKGDRNTDMKKILSLMGLGIQQGDQILCRIEGLDEEACAAALQAALEETF